jgi:hypothetical protein
MGQNGEVVSLYLEEVVGGFDLYGAKLDKEKLADKLAFFQASFKNRGFTSST